MSDRTKAILLIFFLTLVVYSNSLGGKFVSDDEYFIVKNVNVKSLRNIPDFFSNRSAVAFADLSMDVYRPVTTLSFAIDYLLCKLNAFGYHLVNVLFHSFNAILLCIFLYALFGDIWIAMFASLFFALHPVETEVVSWISGRSSVLFLFFYLSALLLYIRGKILPSLVLFAVSLFSKEMAVTLPILLVAYDIHFPKKEPLRRKIYKYIPYFTIVAVFILMRAFVLKRVSQCGWWGDNPYYTFLSMTVSFLDYLKILLLPVNQCAFYITKVYTTVFHPKVLLGLAIFLVSLGAIPLVFKRSKKISFFICWCFITILPVTNIVPLKALMAERFLYIPSIGFCVLLAVLLRKQRKTIQVAAAVSIVIIYGFLTMVRNGDWRDSVFLAKSVIKVSPQNPWGYTCLGAAYLGDENYLDAEKALKKSIELDKGYSSPKTALGFCYVKTKKYKEAAELLTESLKLDPGNLEAMNLLGVSYGNLRRNDEAIREFEDSIAIDPTFVSAYLNLGATYEFMKKYDKAIGEYSRALARSRSAVDIALLHVRIGDVYIKMKDFAKAREEYVAAVSICENKFIELAKIANSRLTRLDEISKSASAK
ncbi:MAG: tetratricopeptide repeat protein [Candidatus Omnitrophica bacterium]|nr:tetratricopeptide repeat protein [Candidatus Omnitrophota bacterium]